MNCNNNPPAGYISNASNATIVDSVTVETCNDRHEIAFDINPADADNGHNINIAAHGLPKDARLDITNNNTTRPLTRFVWSLPEGFQGGNTFFVTYTDDGCPIASKQTQAYTIRLDEGCNVAGVPTAFTPNGDGKNDILFVMGPKNVQEMYFKIYNRWGQLVFETRDIKTGWDGRFNGEDAPVESYAYVVSVVFRNGRQYQKQGNITLLR